MRLPERCNRVGAKGRVGNENGNLLDDGLGDDHAIERVAVVVGKRAERDGVSDRDWQCCNCVEVELIWKKRCEGFGESDLSETCLDGHFPDAGDAQENVVGRIFDESSGVCAEPFISLNKPQERVRVEEQAHYV